MRTFDLKNPQDLVSLAREVQSMVYWGYSYYDVSENSDPEELLSFKYFWDICESYMNEGLTKVSIDHREVRFYGD